MMLKRLVSRCRSRINETGSKWFVDDVKEGVKEQTLPDHLDISSEQEDGFLLVGETRSERSTVGPESGANSRSQSQFYLDAPPSYESLGCSDSSNRLVMGSGQSRTGSNSDESTTPANEDPPVYPGTSAAVAENQVPDSSDDEMISLGNNPQSNGPIEVVPSAPRTVYDDIPFRLASVLSAALHNSQDGGVTNLGDYPSRNYTYDFSLERTTLRDSA